MYQPSTEYNSEIARWIFTECACWAVLENLKWALLFNVSSNKSFEEISNIYSNKEVAFCFYLCDSTNSVILIGFNQDYKEAQMFIKSLKTDFSFDWRDILNKICERSWENFDFNKTILIWDFVDQQSVGELIDSMNGGLVMRLPKFWQCVPKNNNWSRTWQEKLIKIRLNSDYFKKWCDEVRDDKRVYARSIDFPYWMEKNYPKFQVIDFIK